MTRLTWKHKKVFHIVGGILVLILGFYFKTTVDNSSFVIRDNDLTTLNGLILVANPVYVERHGKGTNEHILNFGLKIILKYLKLQDLTTNAVFQTVPFSMVLKQMTPFQ